MLRRSGRAVVAIALVVSLAACVETTRLPAAEPSPTAAPLFASDEEALAAATEAYEEYLAASGGVTASADLDIEPIRGLVTDSYFSSEEIALEKFEERGLRTNGQSELVSSRLQQRYLGSLEVEILVIYVCVDVSGVRVVDLDDLDVTPVDRPDFSVLEVEMHAIERDRLLVNSSTAWQDQSVCG